MTLRVNALRFARDEYLGLLAEAGIEAKATRFAPHGIQLAHPVPVDQLPWFADGAVPVPEGFEYQSDSNPERLDARALQSILNEKLALKA